MIIYLSVSFNPIDMNLPLSSPLGNLRWTRNNELVTLVFHLKSLKNSYLYLDYCKGLHAWFLHQVRDINPQLSAVLHDAQTEKAFSVSRLAGDLKQVGHKLEISHNREYKWYLSALSSDLVEFLGDWLANLPSQVGLNNAPLEIIDVQFCHPPTTYRQLFNLEKQPNFCFTFTSPTSFRRQGHHFPLPVPQNLFHSYLRRWNNFSEIVFSQEDFLDWVEQNVLILRHNIESYKVAGGKKGAVTGFTGAIELSLEKNGQNHPQYYQLYNALCQFAPYCGTGHKTTFGLGQTRMGWLLDSVNILSGAEVLLDARIDELISIFMAQQKRQGGERALKICTTYATIVARRELGESLQAIALDLNLPYETTKSYSKRALKYLR